MTESLLIVGASVRAAAHSAQRGGFHIQAIDLFNDLDLQSISDCRLSIDYPDDLAILSQEFPDSPFLYTGALENFPDVVSEIAESHFLLGNEAPVLKNVRDPFWLENFLRDNQFASLELRPHNRPPDDPSNWLIKPRLSGHGLSIRYASANVIDEQFYYQKFAKGDLISAVFLANGRDCRFLGCHRQFAGIQPEETEPWQFCGVEAPCPVGSEHLQRIEELGRQLVLGAGLKGLFGCDFIISDHPFLLEVNPRYTFGMELWDRILERSMIAEHVAACRSRPLPPALLSPDKLRYLKLIVYAPVETLISSSLVKLTSESMNFELVDLPRPGSQIPAHAPVCSLIVSGPNAELRQQFLTEALNEISDRCGWTEEIKQRLGSQIGTGIAIK